MIRNLLQSLQQLLGSWWKVDRIRVSANTGRLFQLAAGDRLLIHEQLLIVHKRSLLPGSVDVDTDQSAAAGVEYCLRIFDEESDSGEACDADRIAGSASNEWRLQVVLPNASHGNLRRLWVGDTMEELMEDEIMILPPAGRR